MATSESKKSIATLFVLTALALACGGLGDTAEESGTWQIENARVSEDSTLHYVSVKGTVTQNDVLGGFGADATVKFYSDEYQTLIIKVEEDIGMDLEEEGETQEFDIGHYTVWVLPSTDGYERVCATLQVDDSNYETETELGCVPQ